MFYMIIKYIKKLLKKEPKISLEEEYCLLLNSFITYLKENNLAIEIDTSYAATDFVDIYVPAQYKGIETRGEFKRKLEYMCFINEYLTFMCDNKIVYGDFLTPGTDAGEAWDNYRDALKEIVWNLDEFNESSINCFMLWKFPTGVNKRIENEMIKSVNKILNVY